MKKRGRPKGSTNKKSKKSDVETGDVVIKRPKDAKVWHEIWHNEKFYGWANPTLRPGIETLLNSANGNISKAKKLDYNDMYFPFLVKEKPVGKKGAPVFITRTY